MVCEFCSKQHDGSFGSGRFCNKECSHAYSRLAISKAMKEKHRLACEAKIEAWKRKELNPLKKGKRLRNFIRRYIFEKYNNRCAKCGWNEINPITGKPPLEIDHIDGNVDNSWEDNLVLLCPNCHALTPYWKALNAGRGSKERLNYSRLVA